MKSADDWMTELPCHVEDDLTTFIRAVQRDALEGAAQAVATHRSTMEDNEDYVNGCNYGKFDAVRVVRSLIPKEPT